MPSADPHSPSPRRAVAAVRRIVALAFETPARAQQALASALRLQAQDLIVVHDAVFVTRHVDGSVALLESHNPATVAAAVPSTLFGALVGTLVAGPLGLLVGGALGGGGWALVARVVDSGIPHRVVGDLQELTRPGQTVLALMVSDIAGMAVIEELRRFRGARVVYAEVPAEALELMRQVLSPGRTAT